jgi:hypothetical protein
MKLLTMAQACNLMKLSRSPLAKPQVGDSQHSGLVCVVNNNSSITIGFMMVSRCSKHVNYNYSFLEFTNQLYLKKTTAGQYLVISAYSITSQEVGIQLLSDGNNINI